MCVVDQLTGGRLDFGVGRGVAPIEHYWFGSNWPSRRNASWIRSASSATRSRPVRSRSANRKFYDFPTIPLATKPVQDPIPFWYPGNPVTAGRHGMNLMWPGPIDQASYDVYVETWHKHKGDTIRVDGPSASHASAARCCSRSRRPRARRSTSPGAAWTGCCGAPTTCTSTIISCCPRTNATQRSARCATSWPTSRTPSTRGAGTAEQITERFAGDPRARPHRLHRAAAPDGRHDPRRSQTNDGRLLRRREARPRNHCPLTGHT